jgi:hypothetical protein
MKINNVTTAIYFSRETIKLIFHYKVVSPPQPVPLNGRGRVINTLASFSERPGFESGPGDRLS